MMVVGLIAMPIASGSISPIADPMPINYLRGWWEAPTILPALAPSTVSRVVWMTQRHDDSPAGSWGHCHVDRVKSLRSGHAACAGVGRDEAMDLRPLQPERGAGHYGPQSHQRPVVRDSHDMNDATAPLSRLNQARTRDKHARATHVSSVPASGAPIRPVRFPRM